MKPVTIVGSGFSGLTLAQELKRRGLDVFVFEKKDRPGGLLSTKSTGYGSVETAANAIMANRRVFELWRELGVQAAGNNPARRKRYIFWGRPRRWPLSARSSLHFAGFVIKKILNEESVKPKPLESVASWSERAIDQEFGEKLLAPALQGVYAGDVKRMSASLALQNLFGSGPGGRSAAPAGGMGEWMLALRKNLEDAGVKFKFGEEYKVPDKLDHPLVLATGVKDAARLLESTRPDLAGRLNTAEVLPLVSVTAFFEPDAQDPRGFGCLFPESQGFSALGVLFNDCIFEGRSSVRSETWILGGASGASLVRLTDEEILTLVLRDRRKLKGREQTPLEAHVTKWPEALPHYTLEWEKTLRTLEPEAPLFLHGNYLGKLGLAGILDRSIVLAGKIKEAARE